VFAEIGDRQGQAISENIRGTAAMKDGDYGAAIETFNRSIELFRAAGVDQGRGVARRNLGEAFAKRDETETARDHWRTALETFEDVGAPDDELETLELLVEACRDAGDEEEARRWCRRARDALSGAPDPVAKRHREWVSESETALEAD
jgi:tetratricopeptide (TPR) repeat protein